MRMLLHFSIVFFLSVHWQGVAAGNFEEERPVIVAKDFLGALDVGDYSRAYRNTGRQYRQRFDINQFVWSIHELRQGLGGNPYPSGKNFQGSFGRTLIDARAQNQIEGSRETGQYYALQFVAAYKNGRILESIYVQNEGDDWRIVGVWFRPYFQ